MGIPSKWGYHPLLVGGKNSWISGLEVCMAADSPLANPQDLSTQIIRAADEVSWHQWDGEGVPTRAVHPESVAFPTENQRNSLHFFFEVRSIWRFAGIGLLEPQIFSQSWWLKRSSAGSNESKKNGRSSLWSSLPKWSSSWLLWGWSGVREPWHALTGPDDSDD